MSVDTEYLKNRVKEIRETINELKRLTSKTFNNLTREEIYAMRYQMIVLAEALGSICLHIAIEDFGYEPDSYADCFKFLENKNFIRSDELIKIRLRNLLVHRYWTIDDSKIYEAMKNNFEDVEKLLEVIEEKYGI